MPENPIPPLIPIPDAYFWTLNAFNPDWSPVGPPDGACLL